MMISVTDLSVARGGIAVLAGVSFDVAAGQALILRGPNGVGKTTLLRTIAGLQPALAGQVVPGPGPAHAWASRQDGGVLTGAAVIPAAGAAHLTAKLDQRHVQGRLHQAPHRLGQERLGGGDVLWGAVVAGDGDGALGPARHRGQGVRQGLEHQGLHHAAAVTEHVAAEAMKHLVAVGPGHGAVNRRLAHPGPAVVHQRLPLDVAARGHAGLLFTQGARGVELMSGAVHGASVATRAASFSATLGATRSINARWSRMTRSLSWLKKSNQSMSRSSG